MNHGSKGLLVCIAFLRQDNIHSGYEVSSRHFAPRSEADHLELLLVLVCHLDVLLVHLLLLALLLPIQLELRVIVNWHELLAVLVGLFDLIGLHFLLLGIIDFSKCGLRHDLTVVDLVALRTGFGVLLKTRQSLLTTLSEGLDFNLEVRRDLQVSTELPSGLVLLLLHLIVELDGSLSWEYDAVVG